MTDTPLRTQPHDKKFIEVLGKKMAYVELGDPNGRPIIFQHGNPTSSYLWRNVMPHLAEQGRCIAIDLIGMGDSEKLAPSADSYSFDIHSQYFEATLAALGVRENAVLVIHDWGSALGFHYAARHSERVAGICYMEGIVMPVPSWDDWPEGARNIFQAFRSVAGETVVLEKNIFVEGVLPSSIIRDLQAEEMAVYRAPFATAGEDRRPTLSWPRDIPIAGSPANMVTLAEQYGAFMADTPIPKLFINAEPGSILVGKMRDFCRSWKNQTEVTVSGTHFIQEDSPHEIGQAIKSWINDNSI
ncbi:haloalkane dehalogenase [Alphaproteobacteria bacterium]|nr:haloalkane dehalogenase [Alphaproteobacteria bacterium]